MRIPMIGDSFTNPYPSGMLYDNRSFAPVTKNNTKHLGYSGNGEWAGNKFTVKKLGFQNCWYLKNCSNVAFCVVPHNGGRDAYVISRNYGGCEYHTLYHRQYKLLAFLHVMRGGNKIPASYTMAPGWERMSVHRSAHISKRHSGQGLKWSYSCIRRTGEIPKIYTCFLYFDGGFMVKDKDSGTTPYGQGDDAD